MVGRGKARPPHLLLLHRRARALRGPVEPELSGCVVANVCWYLALIGKDQEHCLHIPAVPRPRHTDLCQGARAVPILAVMGDGWCDRGERVWEEGKKGDGVGDNLLGDPMTAVSFLGGSG